MRYLLDEEALDGPHPARITFRPHRVAQTFDPADPLDLARRIGFECQTWGGASTPMLPITKDGELGSLYRKILAGSSVDLVSGMDIYGLYNLDGPPVTVTPDPSDSESGWGRQVSVALLRHGKQAEYRPLQIMVLKSDDPWREIYLASLGTLPAKLDANLLRHGYLNPELQLDDFLRVERLSVEGSLEDLTARLTSRATMSPRNLSMVHLSHGNTGSTSIRSKSSILPDKGFARWDAGPNIVVVCTPGNAADIALLWNLRAAHGDHGPLPIGIPFESLDSVALDHLVTHPQLPRNGIAENAIYLTSVSQSSEMLRDKLGTESPQGMWAIVEPEFLVSLGRAPGWTREEILVWQDGVSRFVPLIPGSYRHVFQETGFNENTFMRVDVDVTDVPMVIGDDIRMDATNFAFFDGRASRSVGDRRSEPVSIDWPTRLLTARGVAARRNLELQESEPGLAARVALTELDSISDLFFLCHGPLLKLLEEMASREGMSWYRNRLRARDQVVEPNELIGRTTDDLPERTFDVFKAALGNNTASARYWLMWAEKAGFIVKGFTVQCQICMAKQWIPIVAFRPPIPCRGCGKVIASPFGDRSQVNFLYRISERLRRVFEHDALSHLLVMRFFHSLFRTTNGSQLIGSHPGMEIRRQGGSDAVGEADVLLLFQNSEFVATEVKRSFTGVTDAELQKLDLLASTLNSSWSAIAVSDYAIHAPENFASLQRRGGDDESHRLILTYDHILDSSAVWSMGSDPFAWRPLDAAGIAERERWFVTRLSQLANDENASWLEFTMLHRPEMPEPRTDV